MRQQYQQKPRQKGREDLLASTVYTKVPMSGGALYRKLMINDGDPSTYSGRNRIGPGPANPNGAFGIGPRESSKTITKQQFQTEASDVRKRANAERAKARGFRSVTEMMQADQRFSQQYKAKQERERLEKEREWERKNRENRKRREAEQAREKERQRIAEEQRVKQARAELARQNPRLLNFYDERMRRFNSMSQSDKMKYYGSTDPAYVNP